MLSAGGVPRRPGGGHGAGRGGGPRPAGVPPRPLPRPRHVFSGGPRAGAEAREVSAQKAERNSAASPPARLPAPSPRPRPPHSNLGSLAVSVQPPAAAERGNGRGAGAAGKGGRARPPRGPRALPPRARLPPPRPPRRPSGAVRRPPPPPCPCATSRLSGGRGSVASRAPGGWGGCPAEVGCLGGPPLPGVPREGVGASWGQTKTMRPHGRPPRTMAGRRARPRGAPGGVGPGRGPRRASPDSPPRGAP